VNLRTPTPRLLAALLLQLALARPAQAARELVSYWKDTGLTFADVEQNFTDKACYHDAGRFMGCVGAINTLVAGENLAFTNAAERAKDAFYGKVVQDFGEVKLVAVDKDKIPTLGYRVQIERIKEARKAWAAIYRDRTRPVPFGKVVDWFKANLLAKLGDTQASVSASALNAYLNASIDPHTSIVPRQYMEDEQQDAGEHFSGIGARLSKIEVGVAVEVLEGSPAEKAGVLTGDVVVGVDDYDARGKPLDEVVRRIRGPEGTDVVLSVVRDGAPVKVTVKRGKIDVPNVEWKLLADGATGYVKLSSFMDLGSCDAVEGALRALREKDAKGLVLDLRSNGGGRVDVALCVAGLFLPPDQPIYEMRRLDPRTGRGSTKGEGYEVTEPRRLRTELPLVVLVNPYSASASEILSGAFQDHGRAVILGERTFGKGSAQSIQPSPLREGIVVWRTTQRFYLPSGRSTQGAGVTPDLTVHRKLKPTEDDLVAFREEDLYANPLPEEGPAWKQPRPAYVAGISSCLATGKKAESAYQAKASSPVPPDLQLLTAQEALGCMRARPVAAAPATGR
jgi:carboxyl-terminal processing protease